MSASKIEPLKKPFNLRSLADRIEIRRLVYAARCRGWVHITKPKKAVAVPRDKMLHNHA